MRNQETLDRRVFLGLMTLAILCGSAALWCADQTYGLLPDPGPRLKAAPYRAFHELRWYGSTDSSQTSKDVEQ
jgi:hypothetical protein